MAYFVHIGYSVYLNSDEIQLIEPIPEGTKEIIDDCCEMREYRSSITFKSGHCGCYSFYSPEDLSQMLNESQEKNCSR